MILPYSATKYLSCLTIIYQAHIIEFFSVWEGPLIISHFISKIFFSFFSIFFFIWHIFLFFEISSINIFFVHSLSPSYYIFLLGIVFSIFLSILLPPFKRRYNKPPTFIANFHSFSLVLSAYFLILFFYIFLSFPLHFECLFSFILFLNFYLT